MSYESDLGKHIVDAYFAAAKIIPSEPFPEYRRTENYTATQHEHDLAAASLKGDRWVAVCPGPTTWDGKRWGKFYDLCWWLVEQRYRVLLVGLRDMERSFPTHLDRRGTTSIPQVAALIKRCQLFIGVDSYLMHVAESLDVPTIGIFGVTDPKYIMTKPSSIGVMGKSPCAGERHRVPGIVQMSCDGSCINSVSLRDIVTAVQKVMNR